MILIDGKIKDFTLEFVCLWVGRIFISYDYCFGHTAILLSESPVIRSLILTRDPMTTPDEMSLNFFIIYFNDRSKISI